MSKSIKIAIIGDFNFTYNTHHATNLAIDHATRYLEIEINYYWLKLEEAVHLKPTHWKEYDGVWIGPGPYKNGFYLNGIMDQILKLKVPSFVTGDAFRIVIESFIQKNNLNPNGEKLISENLVDGTHFERVEIIPASKNLNKIYENHNTIELTASRFSLYPQLLDYLLTEVIDIEAYNQYDEAEILSLKGHPFFVLCAFCPQISSTREIPHPLVNAFLNICAVNQREQIE